MSDIIIKLTLMIAIFIKIESLSCSYQYITQTNTLDQLKPIK